MAAKVNSLTGIVFPFSISSLDLDKILELDFMFSFRLLFSFIFTSLLVALNTSEFSFKLVSRDIPKSSVIFTSLTADTSVSDIKKNMIKQMLIKYLLFIKKFSKSFFIYNYL